MEFFSRVEGLITKGDHKAAFAVIDSSNLRPDQVVDGMTKRALQLTTVSTAQYSEAQRRSIAENVQKQQRMLSAAEVIKKHYAANPRVKAIKSGTAPSSTIKTKTLLLGGAGLAVVWFLFIRK